MPTRRTMELIVITVVLMKPAFGVLRLWTTKTLGSYPPGSPLHTVAAVSAVAFA
jgi:hypothetical protein